MAAILSFVVANQIHAQLSCTTSGTPVTITFDGTLAGVVNGVYAGTGFLPAPGGGQLDSDAWAATGWSDGPLAFGGTITTGDYARGSFATAQTTGGFYAFTNANIGSSAFGIQPGGGDWAPGTLTLRIQNNTGGTVTDIDIAYELWVRNDQARSNSFNFSWSTDNVTYTPVPALDFTSTAAIDALGFQLNNRSTTISGQNIAPSGFFYVRWSGADVGGSGSRDEFALDDITVEMTGGVVECGLSIVSQSATCDGSTPGDLDTYSVSIEYAGIQPGVTIEYEGSGDLDGSDDPANDEDGMIIITGIPETENYSVTFSAPCDALVVSGDAPECDPPPTTTIVINEVDADDPGTDETEFIELFGPANESLTGMVLVLYNGSNDLSYNAIDLDGFSLDANGFFVVGSASVPNVDLISFTTDGVQNGADAVALYFGSASDFPLNTPVTTTNIIDALVYDTNDPDDAGLLVLLNAGQPQVDENGGGSPTTQSNSRVPDGGTQRNTDTYVQQFITPGTTNVPPCGIVPGTASVQCTTFNPGPGNDTYTLSIPYAGVQAGITVVNNSGSGSIGGSDPATTANGTILITGISEANNYSVTFTSPCNSLTISGNAPACEPPPAIVINEIDYDQPGSDQAEFIELRNNGASSVDLAGFTLQLINGTGTAVYQSYVLPSFLLAPGGYYVVCQVSSSVPNCNLNVIPNNTPDGTVQNGAPDAVGLRDASNNLLDAVSYEGNTGAPYTEGTGVVLGDLNNVAGVGIARFPDGTDTQNNDDDLILLCITPGTANIFADADNDNTQDCLDLCAGPEPGSPCDDEDENTGEDTVQGDCTCLGIALDCEGVPGGSATPGTPCDDLDAGTVEDVWTAECECEGVPVDCLGVPNGPNMPGTPCNDFNSTTVFDTWQEGCTCVGQACTIDLTLEFQTDVNAEEISWEIRQQGTNLLIQSGPAVPLTDNATATDFTCLINGCYYLKVIDAGGDGITNGGYILRTSGNPGTRIIDNRRNFSDLAGGPPDVSRIANGEGFCLPLGPTSTIFTSCDKLDWVTGEYVVCSAVPAISALWNAGNLPTEATSGYEFQVFNPNGGYIFNRFRAHNVSDGFAPDNATRACHMKINNWAAPQHIPANTLMNVRIRTRNTGVNGNWGPACRFMIDPVAAACPRTNLMDIPGDANLSCNSTRAWGNGNYIHARPVSGATQYQWRFRIDAENFVTIRTTTTYFIQLNWATLPLQDGKTYTVEVRAFKNGAWCVDTSTPAPGPNYTPWNPNKPCLLTIDDTPFNGGGENMVMEGGDALHMYPNPNRGDQLYVTLDTVDEGVATVSVDIVDMFGKRVSARTIAVTDGFINTVLDLDGTLSDGLYLVNITAGEQRYTERMVIQK